VDTKLKELPQRLSEIVAGVVHMPTQSEVLEMMHTLVAALVGLHEDARWAMAIARPFAPPVVVRRDPTTASIEAQNQTVRVLEAVLANERKAHAVTQAQLDKFLGACADQTLQIMELRGEIGRGRDDAKQLDELRAKLQRLERTATPMESALASRVGNLRGELSDTERMIKKWDAQIDAVLGEAPRDGETYADAAVRKIDELRHELQGMRGLLETYQAAIARLGEHLPTRDPGESVIEHAIAIVSGPCDDCKVLSDEIDRMTEIAMTADGDRVPLAMDCAELRSEIARMKPLVNEVSKWDHLALPSPVHEALTEYRQACSAAADDDIAF
jgi:chromosome segregation ATPase